MTMVNKSKVGKVMREFKSGSLHSGAKSGPKVTSPQQAKAIAMSEAGMSKYGGGGLVTMAGGEKGSGSGVSRGTGKATRGKKFCGVY